jgi:uncharacterized membrane protein YobD (UPF0266 family)
MNTLLPYITHIKPDTIVLVALVIGLTAISISWGTARACVIALTIPVSAFLFTLVHDAAFASTINEHLTNVWLQSGLFFLIAIFVYIMTHRMYRSYHNEGESLVLALLAGMATAIIVVVVWVHTPALVGIWTFNPFLTTMFGASYALWWFIVSFLLLGYVRS